MTAAWLQELLPQAASSPRTRILWALFFALFPLAYLGGVMLQLAEQRPARIDGATDRAAAIATAQSFAAAKGFHVSDWHRYAVAETHDDLLSYYDANRQPDLAAARLLAPAREVQVLFRSSDYRQEFRVYLSLTGRVTGYDIGKSSAGKHVTSNIGFLQVNSSDDHSQKEQTSPAPDALSDAETEAIARRAVAANSTLSALAPLGKPKINFNADDLRRSDVEWDASPAGRNELKFNVKVSVRDSSVVAQRVQAAIDKSYAKSRFAKKSNLPVVLDSVYGLFLTFAAVYAIYRYARRTLQKEVSHARTLIVAALFCVSYSALAYSFAVDQIATRVSSEAFAQITLISDIASVLAFAVMGLLVGIGYGSGEGEVRESYPGKLTSLDALLAGRIFSRDVAASFLFGAAAAGWLLLCHHALSHFLPIDVAASRSDALRYTFARLPWLTLLLGKQYDSLLIAVTGLLVPASFLARSGMRRKRRFAWLLFFAVFSVLRNAAAYPTADAAILATAIFVSALLLPFFAFDLLAAMVSLSALFYVDQLDRLSAVFPSWTGFSVGLAAFASAALALAAFLAVRGRRVREEDVRPTYARNLAERMSMQAEILAAREAQLRLLPQSAPEIPGFQLAACCLPAHGVGGDFYDFFRLDANRVGIFVAQGGDQGLASALCIALAKGLLMHASQQPQSPTQIILGLEAGIAELLQGGSAGRISFAYAVIDTQRKLLNYARIGDSPRLLIYRAGAGLTTSAQLEREAPVPKRSKNAPPVFEGAALLQLGDHLIFFTDGITALRTRRFGKREYQWLHVLMREMERHHEPLQTSLVSALTRYHHQASRDLTAVVVRVVESQALLREGVA